LTPEEEQIALSALEVAENLASTPETLDQFVAEGGIKAVLDLMKNNKENPKILTKGAEALAKLAKDEDIINEVNDLGGLDLINEIM